MTAPDKSDIDKGWVSYLRNSRRLNCPDCGGLDIHPPILKTFRAHVQQHRDRHPSLVTDSDIQEAFDKIKLSARTQNPASTSPADNGHHAKRSRKRPVQTATPARDDAGRRATQHATPEVEDDADERDSKKHCSPTSSIARAQTPQQPQPQQLPMPGRSRGRQTERTSSKPGAPGGRKLWTPEDEPPPRSTQARVSQNAASSAHVQQRGPPRPRHAHGQGHGHGHGHARQLPTPAPSDDDPPEDPSVTRMIRQPETRPISQEQLVAEVKGIYAGLVMIEAKCIEVDNAQSSNKDSLRQLNNEQWQVLITLHRTLLHEHHDFFLASQHPSASPALRRLAAKYAMPARMWRHGIHSFLELLRHKLPMSLEPMLTFIYIAYSMMALLYETVPTFEDTWIECLGDLGRYRMAIEDDDIRDRETWLSVSRYWYSKASDHSPTTGRLYHHLAILARPNALQQVYYYAKSLCVPTPFTSARESVMTLFDPVLSSSPPKLEAIDAAFVRIHAILFSGKSKEQLAPALDQFYTLLDGQIARTTKGWLESGYFIGISIACALLGYGNESNALMQAISPKSEEAEAAATVTTATATATATAATTAATTTSTSASMSTATSTAAPVEAFEQTLDFAVRTYEIITRRWGDMNILTYLHTTLVFLRHLSKYPAAMSHIEAKFPWKLTAMMLNYLKQSSKVEIRMESEEFPGAPQNEVPRPLPEDYAMRGLIYADDYFPDDWFSRINDDEKYFELASMMDERRERILWLGRRIATLGKWLQWDARKQEFFVSGIYDVDLDHVPAGGQRHA